MNSATTGATKMNDLSKDSVAALEAGYAHVCKERDALRSALKLIASCESHTKGDVVDIARAALAQVQS